MANSIQDKLLQSALKLLPGGLGQAASTTAGVANILSKTTPGKQVTKAVQKFTVPKLDPGEPFAAKPKSDFQRVIEGDVQRLQNLFPQQVVQEAGERKSQTDLRKALETSLAAVKSRGESIRQATPEEVAAVEKQRTTTFNKREMSDEDFAMLAQNNPLTAAGDIIYNSVADFANWLPVPEARQFVKQEAGEAIRATDKMLFSPTKNRLSDAMEFVKQGLWDPATSVASVPIVAALDLASDVPVVGKPLRETVDFTLGAVSGVGGGSANLVLDAKIPGLPTLRETFGEEGSRAFVESFEELAFLGIPVGAKLTSKGANKVAKGVTERMRTPEYAAAFNKTLLMSPNAMFSSVPGGTQISKLVSAVVEAEKKFRETSGRREAQLEFEKSIKDLAEGSKKELGVIEDVGQATKKADEALGDVAQGERSFIARSIDDAKTPEEVAMGLEKNPNRFYEVVSDKRAEEIVSNLSDTAKEAILYSESRFPDKITSKVGLDLIKQAEAAGKHDISINIRDRLATLGTRSGQFIQGLKDIDLFTPQGIVKAIERKIESRAKGKAKIPEMSSVDKKIIEGLATEYKKFDPKSSEGILAGIKLQNAINTAIPKKAIDLYNTAIQGSLLTVKSLVRNVSENALFMPFEAAGRGIATGLDVIDSALTGSPRSRTLTKINENFKIGLGADGKKLIETAKERIEKAKETNPLTAPIQGISEAIKIAWNQNKDFSKYDISDTPHPVLALKKFMQRKDLPFSQRATALFEAVVGAVPSTMFNALQVGDIPFYKTHFARGLNEAIKLQAFDDVKGLKGAEQSKALRTKIQEYQANPTEKMIEFATNEAQIGTFQQKNALASAFNSIKKLIPEPLKPLGNSNVPFVTTPANIAKTFLEFVPEFGYPVALYKRLTMKGLDAEAMKARKRESLQAAGRATVGWMMAEMSKKLAETGVIQPNPTNDKERDLMYTTGVSPDSINVDAFIRMMTGQAEFDESGKVKQMQGDSRIGLTSFGLLGDKFKAEAAAQYARDRGIETSAVDNIFATLNNLKDKSFLQGVDNFMNAFDNEYYRERLLSGNVGALMSPFIPNQVTQILNADDPYLLERTVNETGGEGLLKAIENTIKEKLGMTESLPIKLDVFGQPVPKTPEGANAYVYNLIDIYNQRPTNGHPLAVELMNVVDDLPSDQINSVIPTARPKIIPGSKQRFSSEAWVRFNQIYGDLVMAKGNALIESDTFKNANPEEKALMFEKTWSSITRGSGSINTMFKGAMQELGIDPVTVTRQQADQALDVLEKNIGDALGTTKKDFTPQEPVGTEPSEAFTSRQPQLQQIMTGLQKDGMDRKQALDTLEQTLRSKNIEGISREDLERLQ